jgi:hypothetical protein
MFLLLLLAGRGGADDGDGAARCKGQGRLGPLLAVAAQEDRRGHESRRHFVAQPLEQGEERMGMMMMRRWGGVGGKRKYLSPSWAGFV